MIDYEILTDSQHYLGQATITKHNLLEVPREDELRNKQW